MLHGPLDTPMMSQVQPQSPAMWSGAVQTDAMGQDQPDFMSAVMKMDNELHDEDIDSMKFLCQGLVQGSKLKRVETVHELISLLENSNEVKHNDFFLLAELLQYIGRVDVLEKIGFEEKEVIFRRRQQGSSIKPFYVLLFQIAEELPTEDVKKAVFAYGKVPRSQSQNMSSGLDLFTAMVQRQSIRPENVELLARIFDSLERQDIVELIQRYTETNGQSVMHDLEQNFIRIMSFRGNDYSNLFPAQVRPGERFARGMGPSVNDMDVGNKAPINCSSEQGSLINHPEFVTHSEPSAPPASLPSMGPRDPSMPPPAEGNPGMLMDQRGSHIPVVSPAIEGYDSFVIPWNVLDILSRNIPAEFWPELSYRLGASIQGDWAEQRRNRFHKLAVLKKWLELPETRAMDEFSTKIFLVKALAAAGPSLMAEEIARELNVDFNAVMQESTSTVSGVSVYDTNDIASQASAAHMSLQFEAMQQRRPESARNPQPTSMAAAMAQLSPYGGPVPIYPMINIPRGICLIINNRDFFKDRHQAQAKQMVKREGTDVDRDKLENTFRLMNFRVSTHNNLTDHQMVRLMNDLASRDHSHYDCFVCCILTHGVQGALYGTNGMTVPIRDLTGPFRSQSCPDLAGKPKLFFMQACQGRDKQGGHRNDIQMDSQLEEDSPPTELIPNEADFLLGYATVPGFVSYRSKTRGSWYITKLTEMLQKYSHDHDILDILTLVNFEVGKGNAEIDGGTYKQSPAPMYSLRKKLIFSPVQ